MAAGITTFAADSGWMKFGQSFAKPVRVMSFSVSEFYHPKNRAIRFNVVAKEQKNSGKKPSITNPSKPSLKAKVLELHQSSLQFPRLQREASSLCFVEDELSSENRGRLSHSNEPEHDQKKQHRMHFSWTKAPRSLVKFPSKKIRAIVLMNLLTLIYASNVPVIKATEATIDPSLFSLLRFSVTSIPLLPLVFQTWKDSEVRIAGSELGLWVGAGYLTQCIGLITSDAGRASFISALTVIVVPLLDGILGSKVSKITWAGAIMATFGIALLESSGTSVAIGDFWNLLSAIFFGVHMLRTQHFSRTTKSEKRGAVLAYELCVIAILSVIWYFACNGFSGPPNVHLEVINLEDIWKEVNILPWFPILYTGIFSTAFCLWAELDAMRDVGATSAAIIYGLEPVWGAAFAWFFLNERWGPMGWVGASLIIGGSFMTQLFESSTEDV
eukprot:TRINITY_DN5931_c0_g1_i2.p1 TRINITY_DN5931_c0_g1~~TRINITY_DN5931_c0_g1_i2.p1  ORF type:complete len:442 (-),score=75.50 TRINITY_DN5931_c0_g1_i2:449-1774(-)